MNLQDRVSAMARSKTGLAGHAQKWIACGAVRFAAPTKRTPQRVAQELGPYLCELMPIGTLQALKGAAGCNYLNVLVPWRLAK